NSIMLHVPQSILSGTSRQNSRAILAVVSQTSRQNSSGILAGLARTSRQNSRPKVPRRPSGLQASLRPRLSKDSEARLAAVDIACKGQHSRLTPEGEVEMPAYVIAELEVTDPTGFEEYRQMVPATIAQYGGKYL